MFYCLNFYPQLSPELAESIDSIRRVFDPTYPFFKPHITVIFPVHDSVGERPLINHIEQVLSDRNPIEIRLGGFHRTPSHWLLLSLQEGEAELKRLHRALYTGILAGKVRDVNNFIPHIGLGLFVKEGVIQDWFNPREEDFDVNRYEEAFRQAEALPLSERILLDKLYLTTILDSVIDWVRGRRASIPDNAYETVIREFRLGSQNTKS